MSRHELAVLICRTIGLVMFAYAIYIFHVAALIWLVLIAEAIWFDHEILPLRGHDPESLTATGIPAFAAAVGGFLFCRYSERIATLMVRPDAGPVTAVPFTQRDFMTVAFSTAGLFFFVTGLRMMAGQFWLIRYNRLPASELWSTFRTWEALVPLAFGLWLVLGARGIVTIVLWLRSAGLPKSEDAVPPDAAAK